MKKTRISAILLMLSLLLPLVACGRYDAAFQHETASSSVSNDGKTVQIEEETERDEVDTFDWSQSYDGDPSDIRESFSFETEYPPETYETEYPTETETPAPDTGDFVTETESRAAQPINPFDVLYHTPTVDGLLDDAYQYSACMAVGGASPWEEHASDNESFTYFLWDDLYFYACAVVYDESIVTRGDKYVNEAINNYPYCNDAIELWYTFEGDIPSGPATVKKIGLDAFGKRLYSAAREGLQSAHFDDIAYATTRHVDPASPESSYYICEWKIPRRYEMGDTHNAQEHLVYVTTQIFDIRYGIDDTVIDHHGLMGKGEGALVTLGYADDYAEGELWPDGYMHPTCAENNLVGFTFTGFPNEYEGCLNGYMELRLVRGEPPSDDAAFPTRRHSGQ